MNLGELGISSYLLGSASIFANLAQAQDKAIAQAAMMILFLTMVFARKEVNINSTLFSSLGNWYIISKFFFNPEDFSGL